VRAVDGHELDLEDVIDVEVGRVFLRARDAVHATNAFDGSSD
jgi:hypothetical protein